MKRKDYNDDSMRRFDRFNPIMASDMDRVMRKPNKKPVLAYEVYNVGILDKYVKCRNYDHIFYYHRNGLSELEEDIHNICSYDLIHNIHELFDKYGASENDSNHEERAGELFAMIIDTMKKQICAE